MTTLLIVVGAGARIMQGFPETRTADFRIGISFRGGDPHPSFDATISHDNIADLGGIIKEVLPSKGSNIDLVWASAAKDPGLFVANDKAQTDQLISANINALSDILRVVTAAAMPKHQLSAVFLSSLRAQIPAPGTILYAASKRFGETLFQSLATEYGRFNCRYNSVRLGVTAGGLAEDLSIKVREEIMKRIPDGKTVSVEAVWRTINFVLDNHDLNGTTIRLDRGLS